MEALLIRPENEVQLKAIKAVLEALNVPFENHTLQDLPNHVIDSIGRGIKQSQIGELISLNEFKDKHLNSSKRFQN